MTNEYMVPHKQLYYWVRAVHRGRTILVLPKGEAALSEEAAMKWAFTKLPSNFEVVALPTRDTARASRMLKGRSLDETADIDKSMEKYSHKAQG